MKIKSKHNVTVNRNGYINFIPWKNCPEGWSLMLGATASQTIVSAP